MDTDPYLPPQAEIIVSSEIDNADAIQKAHINHEASVKSVGTLCLLGAIVCIISAWDAISSSNIQIPARFQVGATLFFAASALFLLRVGSGLRNLKPAARVIAVVLSGFGLLAFPLGTIINGYVMYLVLSKKGQLVFSPEYKQIIAQTPHIKYKTSIVVWIVLALVIALILAAMLAPMFTAAK